MQRNDIVKFHGKPLTLLGKEVKAGEKARDFKALNSELNQQGLSDFKGKIKLIASVPSLDTPVCDLEIKRFNQEASKVSEKIVIIFISMDLPFAQKRFCQANEIKQVEVLSDHKDASFGENYGALIKELRLLTRAIFILDDEDEVRYVEYVPEMTNQPDFDKALEELKKLA